MITSILTIIAYVVMILSPVILPGLLAAYDAFTGWRRSRATD